MKKCKSTSHLEGPPKYAHILEKFSRNHNNGIGGGVGGGRGVSWVL